MSEKSSESAGAKAARATGVVSIAIMCSRILGLIREQVFAALFGANAMTDAFWMAFKVPNLMRDLFAEGALSTAFVTTFTKKIENEGDDSAWALARKMATLAAVFMSAVVALGMLFAAPIVSVIADGFDADKQAFTVVLVRVMFPFIAIVSLSALVMGMLNAKGKFFVPAIASSFFNLGCIIGGYFIGRAMDPEWGPQALVGFSIGTLIGGLAQLAVQLPSVYKAGFRFWPDFRWNDSGVKKVLSLMLPAVIAGSAIQVSVMLNAFFASHLEGGSLSWIQNAFRLMQLPLGIFGVAIGMVTLPAVSRAAKQGITPEFGAILGRGMRMVLLLTLPSALGLAILAEPVISVIYERGKFEPRDTVMAALALRAYAIGLVFYSGIKVVQPAFYAVDKRWVPMWVSLGVIGLTAAANWYVVFVAGLGHDALAFTTSVGALVNFSILYLVMTKVAGSLHTKQLTSTLAKLAVASAALIGVCLAGQKYVMADWADFGIVGRLGTLLPTIGVAAVVFFAVAMLLKVEETTQLFGMVRRKIGR